jgi:hypothetical protein
VLDREGSKSKWNRLWNPMISGNSVFMKKNKSRSCKKGGFINQQKYTMHKTCNCLTSTWTHTRTYKPSVQKSHISNWLSGYLYGLLSWSLTTIKQNSVLKQSVHWRIVTYNRNSYLAKLSDQLLRTWITIYNSITIYGTTGYGVILDWYSSL